MRLNIRRSLLAFAAIAIAACAAWPQDKKGVLVVLNKNEATMSIIDPVTMKVTAKVPTGDGPHEVVLSPDGNTAYVANYGAQTAGSSFSIIDIRTAKEIRRADLTPLIRPHGIQLIGTKLYFTAEASRAIARYDTVTNKVDWIMGSGQNGTHMVVGTADQKKFYTANIGSDTVTAFEVPPIPQGRRPITHIPVGRQPEAIDLSPDGKEVWIGLNVEEQLEIVDVVGYKSVMKIDTKARPYRVRFTPDGKYVVCTMFKTKEVVLFDAASRKELRKLKVDGEPFGLAFSGDGKTAFVTTVGPDRVIKIDLEKMEITGTGETGALPDGIAVAGF